MSENIIEEYSGEVKVINAGAKGKMIDLSEVPIAECYDCSILEPKQVLFNIVKPMVKCKLLQCVNKTFTFLISK